ncbi:polycystic kidney disease 1-like 2 [Cichlidogyrus casuarinus]|uniref:Polycystic kidney disease 1-like 2 n=1 Tax=Cichlidogyrus casuarinus TaxID=1844966 RepID=A0ABD2PL57_9PLAT
MKPADPFHPSQFNLNRSAMTTMTMNPPGPSGLNLILNYVGVSSQFPNNISLITCWGDMMTRRQNISINQMPLKIMTPTSLHFNGYINASVIVTGPVIDFQFTTMVGSFVPLSDVTVEAFFGKALVPGFGVEANAFPIRTQITVKLLCFTKNVGMNPSFGSAVFSLSPANNATIIQSVVTNASFGVLVLPAVGEYVISVAIQNPYGNWSTKIPVIGTSPFRDLKINVAAKTTKVVFINEEANLQISALAISRQSCLCMDRKTGTETSLLFVGLETTESTCRTASCASNAKLVSGWFSEDANLGFKLLVPAVYTKMGDFLVTITAYEGNSSVSTTQNISVIDPATQVPNCQAPTLEFIPSKMSSAAAPLRKLISDTLAVSASMSLNCSTTQVTIRSWKFWKLDAMTLNVEKQLNTTGFLGLESLTVIIPQHLAKVGFFLVELTVTMAETTVSNYIQGYLSITSSPLSVSILQGGTSFLNISIERSNYTFSPESYSQDPDLKPSEPQKFDSWVWKCWRSDEEESMANKTVYPKSSSHVYSARKTGCFGDGPGILNVTSGTQTWSMNNFDLYQSYFIKVTGIKGDRQGLSVILFTVVNGSPPDVAVMCVRPNLCVMSKTGTEMLVSISNDLILFGNCSGSSSCLNGDYVNWEVYPIINGTTGTKYTLSQLGNQSTNGQTGFIIAKEFYLANPDIRSFRVCFHIGTNSSYGSACSRFSLLPLPPIIGECSTNISQNIPPNSLKPYCATCQIIKGKSPYTFNFYRESQLGMKEN